MKLNQLSEREIHKYEEKERTRIFPVNIHLEINNNIDIIECKNRGEFRTNWSKLIKENFTGVLGDPNIDYTFIFKYGEGIFENNKFMYI